MAEDQGNDQEKTEEATPRRLEKAREEGQVARSRELSTFMLLMVGVGSFWAGGAMIYDQLGLIMEQAFLFERREAFEVLPMLVKATDLVERSLYVMLPIFLMLTLAALVAPVLLGGWLVSAKSLQPQLSKLNPVKGIKRVLGVQALVELAKAIAKSVLVGSVAVAFLMAHRGHYMDLMDQPIQQALANTLELAVMASGLMVLALLVVILIDIPYQLWSHSKKLKMTKEEVKREHKESDGDPQVKARIRQQQQAMARGRMMTKVPEADVIITNPRRYAVALRYDEQGMSAPRLVAKGVDLVAARICEIGDTHGVPRLEAPPLARALYRYVDLDAEIPMALYTAVAEVMAWAFQLRHFHREGGLPPPLPQQLPIPKELQVPADQTNPEART
ncbi:flagellar biosynthesis protein FlhB [Lamprobacter modestohalophilus]|uniref:Flagellar biosynthetic protein FlhB n=1 Tax=Lamprobacter modestohalophilus TaxID=1064514 RepID=A0A9X0W7I7_9GAMM|nr:flagellar biosynthesis protein FlhB [Lamprobacter modestohalophilus]MBK1618385.1 flagellar biosynthesis protein FlhB [Lamprobacter modestohalophilus]